MTNWIDITNYSVALAGLVVVGLSLLLTLQLRFIDRSFRTFFLIFFSCSFLYIASDLVTTISVVFLGPSGAQLTRIAMFLESFFSALLMPMLTVFLLKCAGEDWWKGSVFTLSLTLFLVYLTILIVTQFTTSIYVISDDNVYHRGPYYPVLLVPPVLLMLLNLVALFRRKKRLNVRMYNAFLVDLLLPLLCMLVQMFAYGLLLIVFATALASLYMFGSIVTDQARLLMRQQQINAQQRADIMVLQMRPHFIYNVMMSIYYLCQQDPIRAQQVILDFSSYLRKNFTAVVQEGTIPFNEELEHTRAYLAVEQVRFEGCLFVEFDTPYIAFRLPPLTLQPIVENAVKHGVDPELKPLHIVVRTRKTESGSEITVEDTGPGFSSQESSEPHLALTNIRNRLKLMCRGELKAEPRESGGTKVTIRIPAPKTDD